MNKYKYYLIVDIWNGSGYSDSNAHLVKVNKSNAMKEKIDLLKYMDSLTCSDIANDTLFFGAFKEVPKKEVREYILTDCELSYSDSDSLNKDGVYEDNGNITAYDWEDVKKNKCLMIAPTVCHHEFDSQWKDDFLGMAQECIADGHEDSQSEVIFEDMHTNYEFEDAEFILFKLKDFKLKNAKLITEESSNE